ncbi:hypothetical protein SDJN02_07429, partial [Cucurbita argyrosperma subsp. argyrosperma]
MSDWAPVVIGVVLFVLLSPGLLFQFPGNNRQFEFGSMKTNVNVYVNTDSDDQYGEYAEENDSVHQNGNPTGIHIPKLHHPDSRRQLKKQPWRQDNEQRHRHNNRSPVCTHLNLQEEEECSEVVEFLFNKGFGRIAIKMIKACGIHCTMMQE